MDAQRTPVVIAAGADTYDPRAVEDRGQRLVFEALAETGQVRGVGLAGCVPLGAQALGAALLQAQQEAVQRLQRKGFQTARIVVQDGYE